MIAFLGMGLLGSNFVRAFRRRGEAVRLLDGDFVHPSWELAMARKDARLMMEEAQRGGLPLAIIPAIAKEMDRWIAKGHGKDDWTVIAKDVVG